MTLATAVSRVWAAGLEQLLPARCGVCGAFGSLLCGRCRGALPAAAEKRCTRCWQAYAAGECPRCSAYGCECTAIRAPFVYRGGARRLVTAVKYGGQYALAAPMAALLAAAWPGWRLAADLVVPVPLHSWRRRSRGFNQAEKLARPMAQALGLTCAPELLLRTRATSPQARTISEAERRANIYGAFACADETRIKGRRLLLVDDVTTTGATLGACADVLFQAGAEAVYGLAFAIAG
ncbi:MAG TPA: ComF family protein [Dehalococcoidia bacterium]|nr:ComF family protein [Dehalococcoidia bacterium]